MLKSLSRSSSLFGDSSAGIEGEDAPRPRLYLACHRWASPLACLLFDDLQRQGYDVAFHPQFRFAEEPAVRDGYVEAALQWTAGKTDSLALEPDRWRGAGEEEAEEAEGGSGEAEGKATKDEAAKKAVVGKPAGHSAGPAGSPPVGGKCILILTPGAVRRPRGFCLTEIMRCVSGPRSGLGA